MKGTQAATPAFLPPLRPKRAVLADRAVSRSGSNDRSPTACRAEELLTTWPNENEHGGPSQVVKSKPCLIGRTTWLTIPLDRPGSSMFQENGTRKTRKQVAGGGSISSFVAPRQWHVPCRHAGIGSVFSGNTETRRISYRRSMPAILVVGADPPISGRNWPSSRR